MNNESTAPDLTPAEARAEVEVFLGEPWCADVCGEVGEIRARNDIAYGVTISAFGSTNRAAVDALKAAWRDAVRPWVAKAADQADLECGFGATDGNTRERLVSRVLGEEA